MICIVYHFGVKDQSVQWLASTAG